MLLNIYFRIDSPILIYRFSYTSDGMGISQQFLLFRNPSNVRTGGLATSIISAKRRKWKTKGPKTNCQLPWICLPYLLEVFSKDDQHRLYPDLFKVITIVATLPLRRISFQCILASARFCAIAFF